MPTLTASIVLCTFQSERFLPAQLASLHAQTRPAIEILAQDDGSTDSTPTILKSDPRITFHANPQRLGFAANFSSAIAKAKGDVIFLCDHDDEWEPEKLDTMLSYFERDFSLQLACSEATRIDQNGNPLPGLVLAENGLDGQERSRWAAGHALPFLIRRNAVPGMTMAFRKIFRERFLPVPPGWEHDYWILAVAASLNLPIKVEERPLVRYRQHAKQEIGGTKTLAERFQRAHSLDDRAQEAVRWEPLLKIAEPENRPLIEGKRAHLNRRARFPRFRPGRALSVFAELLGGGYSRYDAGLSSAVKDLLSR